MLKTIQNNFYSLQGQTIAQESQLVRQQISQTSKLADFQDWIQKNPLQSFTDWRKTLGNICLGFATKCSSAEGWSFFEAIPFLEHSIKYLTSHPIFLQPEDSARCSHLHLMAEQIQKGLTDTRPIEEKALTIANTIKGLPPNESYFFAAGWSSHAVLLRFQKKENGTYDVYVYNAQKDSEFRQGGKITAQKTLCVPFFQFSGVLPEELFLEVTETPSLLFENLLKKRTSSEGISYTLDDLLDLFLPFSHRLVPSKEIQKNRPHLLISAQKSGNCAEKTLRCSILDLFDNQVSYKRFNLAQRFFTILYCYDQWLHHNFSSLSKKQPHAFMLEQAIMRFCAQVKEECEKDPSFMTNEALISAIGTMDQLLGHVKKTLATIELQSPINPHQINRNESKERLSALSQTEKSKQALSKEITSIPQSILPDLGKDCRLEDLPKLLEHSKHLFSSLKGKEAILQYEILMSNLRHLKTTQDVLERQKIFPAMQNLQACFFVYVEAKLSGLKKVPPPNAQVTLMETVALARTLAVMENEQTSKKTLKDYGVAFSFFERASSSSFFHMQEKKCLEHHNELLAFFKTLPKERILFDLKGEFALKDLANGLYPEAHFYLSQEPNLNNRSEEVLRLCENSRPESSFLILKDIALLSREAFESRKLPRKISSLTYSIPFVRIQNKYVKTYVVKYSTRMDSTDNDNKQVFPNFPDFWKKEYKLNTQSKYQRAVIESENNFLNKLKQEDLSKPLYRLLNILTVPGAKISVLLQELYDQLPLLSKEELAPLSFFFYKTLDNKETGVISPLFEELEKDKTILERLNLLTEKAFLLWSWNPEKIEHLLFILELQGKWTCQVKQQQVQSSLQLENYCTFTSKIIKEARSDELIFKSLFTKIFLLIGASPPFLSPENKAQLILSLAMASEVFSANLPILKEYREDFSIAAKCYLKKFPEIVASFKNSEHLMAFARAILRQVEPDFTISKIPIIDEKGVVHIENQQGSKVTVDLTNFSIIDSHQEAWGSRKTNSYTVFNHYLERLFQEGLPQKITPLKEGIAFDDPVWGSIQVIDSLHRPLIKRWDSKTNAWEIYYTPDELQETSLHLKDALLFDHIAWINERTKTLTLCDFQGIPIYQSDSTGELKTTSGLNFLNSEPPAVHSFEASSQICYFENARNGDCFLTFPRFNEKPLFSKDRRTGFWVYRNDPTFILDESPHQPVFGTTKYLHLKSPDSAARIVLLPVGTVSSKEFSKKCSIKLPATNSDRNKASLSYCTYDVIGEELQPKNLNGALYLALVLLSQKEYQKALQALEHISMTESTDPLSWKILEQFFPESEDKKWQDSSAKDKKWQDSSAKCQVVRLKAFLKLQALNPYADELHKFVMPIKRNIWTNQATSLLSNCYDSYLRAPRKYERSLVLSVSEEQSIRKRLGCREDERSEFLKNRRLATRATALQVNSKPLVFLSWGYLDDYKRGALEGLRNIMKSIIPSFCRSSSMEETCKEKKELKTQALKRLFNKNLDTTDFLKLYQKILISDKTTIFNQIFYAIHHHKDFSDEAKTLLFFIGYVKVEQNSKFPKVIPNNQEELIPWLIQIDYILEEELDTSNFPDRIRNYIRMLHPFLQLAPANKLAEPVVPKKTKNHQFSESPFNPQHLESEISYERLVNKYLQKREEKAPREDVPVIKKEKQSAQQIHKQHYKKDRRIAQEKAVSKPQLQDPTALAALRTELLEEIDKSKTREEALASFIFHLSNKARMSLHEEALHHAGNLGKNKAPLLVEEICKAATDGENSIQRLHKLTKLVSQEDLVQLKEAALRLMYETTHKTQLERVKESIDQKDSLETIAENLSRTRQYTPLESPFYLHFEWASGFRIRDLQKKHIDEVMEGIKTGRPSHVFQLAMAGGKTSIIGSALFETISNCTPYVPCIATHPSQRASALGNIKQFQKSRFRKDLITLEATLQELSDPKIILKLIDRFHEAKKNRTACFMNSNFPLLLLLKLVIESAQFKGNQEDLAQSRLPLLGQLIDLLKTEGLFFFDEIDTILSVLTDVRVPFGETKQLPAEEIELIGIIYKFLMSKQIDDTLGLTRNEQDQLDKAVLETQILPKVAEHLLASYFYDYQEHTKAALRHLLCQIEKKDQILAANPAVRLESLQGIQRENVLFLRTIFADLQNEDALRTKQAKLFACARFLLKKEGILSTALSRSFRRHYGYEEKKELNVPLGSPKEELKGTTGNVIPFLAVDSPASTAFGHLYLKACLEMQSTACKTVDTKEILFLAEHFKKAAHFYAELNMEPLEENLEAKQWQRMTGQSLFELDQNSLQKAHAFINDENHLERRVNFRAETTFFHVYTFEREAVMTSIDLAHFKNFGCSGTLYNHPTFYRDEASKVVLDLGTEGAVINGVIRKVNAKRSKLFAIEDKSLEGIIKDMKALSNEEKSRCGGLIDIAGFLKKEKNLTEAAIKLLNLFVNDSAFNKKAIVYLERKEDQTENFVLLRPSEEPIILQNTSKKEIEKHGIPLENIFFIWDELRTTGTDYPMAGSFEHPFFSYVTADPKVPMRGYAQGFIRERKSMEDAQEFYIAFSEKERNQFHNNAENIEALFDTGVAVEAKKIEEEMTRSFSDQVESLFKWKGLTGLLDAIRNNQAYLIPEISQRYQRHLIPETNKSDYEQWLSIETEEEPIEYYKQLHQEAFTLEPDLLSSRTSLLKKIEESPHLPEKMSYANSSSHTKELFIEQVQNVEVNLENNREQLMELKQELQNMCDKYQYKGPSRPFEELDWTKDWQGGLPAATIPLSHVMKMHPEFAYCIPEGLNIHITNNLKNTFSNADLSPFDYKFKKSHFALLIKDHQEQLHMILLSKYDRECLTEFLKKNPLNHVWLLNLQGFVERGEEKDPVLTTESAENLLWYSNFFNGTIGYITEKKPITLRIKGSNPDAVESMGKYLLLKNLKNNYNLNRVINSGLVRKKTVEKEVNKVVFSDRRKQSENRFKIVQTYKEDQIKKLTPLDEDFYCMGPHQVNWVAPAYYSALPSLLINYIDEATLSALPLNRCYLLTAPRLIQSLKDPKQIQALGVGKTQLSQLQANQLEHLSAEQLIHLPENRWNIVPESRKTRLKDELTLQLKRNLPPWISSALGIQNPAPQPPAVQIIPPVSAPISTPIVVPQPKPPAAPTQPPPPATSVSVPAVAVFKPERSASKTSKSRKKSSHKVHRSSSKKISKTKPSSSTKIGRCVYGTLYFALTWPVLILEFFKNLILLALFTPLTVCSSTMRKKWKQKGYDTFMGDPKARASKWKEAFTGEKLKNSSSKKRIVKNSPYAARD